jgi:hypothetical protein
MSMISQLTRWHWRVAGQVTTLAAPTALVYTLLRTEPLMRQGFATWAFIYLHCLALTWMIGRYDTATAGYLYSRGYGRRQLWRGRWAAYALCVLAVWGPASLAVWLRLRSLVQDRVLVSPYFPFLAPEEATQPLAWLLGYALLMSMFDFGQVRASQPTRGGTIGYWFTAVIVLFGIAALNQTNMSSWFIALVATCTACAAAILYLGARRLHNNLEVRA